MEILSLGLGTSRVPFEEALALQRQLHTDVVTGNREPTIILVEHESVYTAGRRTRANERPMKPLTTVDVDRGGKVTWHGPGQLVAYPIVRLPQPLDVISYVRALEQAVIDTCQDFDIYGHRVPERSGVWTTAATSALGHREEKIAAIGIRVAQNTTLHGVALNCSNSLEPFRHIVPCGITDAGVTTLSAQSGSTITPLAVSDVLTFHLVENLKEIGVQ